MYIRDKFLEMLGLKYGDIVKCNDDTFKITENGLEEINDRVVEDIHYHPITDLVDYSFVKENTKRSNKMINKKLGNEFESKLLKILQDKGYWCHLFAYSKNGQPCDVVAIKDDIPILLDVKHCASDRFSFSHIQPNQITCFKYAKSCGITYTGFAIYFELQNSWRWLSYQLLEEMLLKGLKSVKYDELRELQ